MKPLTFALISIAVYVVGSSVLEGAAIALFAFQLVLTIAFLGWTISRKQQTETGLCPVQSSAAPYLWFVPLVIVSSVNLIFGAFNGFCLPAGIFPVLSMVLVGFLEEFIFRGLLFTAMRKEKLTTAVIVSSLTFGIGHIVNLLNGAPVFDTLLQICYASALGFLFTMLFHCSGSLIPCILAHMAIDVTHCFVLQPEVATAATRTMDIALSVAVIIVSAGYTLYIMKNANTHHCG